MSNPFGSLWDEVSTSRRRDLLWRTQSAAEKSGVFPQLYSGTLLGYVREGKILDWDDDIDLALFGDQNLQEFCEALHNEGLTTFFHPGEGRGNVKIYDVSGEQIPGCEWGPYIWPYIDLFVFQNRGESLACNCAWNNYSVPRSRVLPGSRASSFEGCRLWLPLDVFYVLGLFYRDWRTYEVTRIWNHRLEKPIKGSSHRRPISTTPDGRKR